MLKSYKYRIYPNKEQISKFEQHFGCCRYIYNWGLNKKIEFYNKEKRQLTGFELQNLVTGFKKEAGMEWLNEINAQSLQLSLRNLDNAFSRFFNKQNKYPKFKTKKYSRKTYQCYLGVKVDFINNLIQLPKIRKIKFANSREFEGDIKTSTISVTPSGKYFISITVDNNKDLPKKKSINKKTTIGIDTGIKNMLTCSDGKIFENNHYLEKEINRIKVLQKRASKKIKGSNNKKKANVKIAKLHEKIKNRREDNIYKIIHKLTNEKQIRTICIEDLDILKMLKNKDLSRSLMDVSLGKFYEILRFKCEWNGINLLQIGKWEASSKTCSNCSYKNNNLTLNQRTWKCPNCNTIHDRDFNASINIKNFALNSIKKSGAGSPIESVEALTLVKPMKQKFKLTSNNKLLKTL